MASLVSDREYIQRIRARDEIAWKEFIAEYEGRLQAFVFSRLRDAALAEDLVQETFLGFLTSLPNYDDSTPLESFLFAIASHKITDVLRRQGRRPMLPLISSDPESSLPEPTGRERVASSLFRSREQRGNEEQIVAAVLRSLIQQWMQRGEFERLKCAELLFVYGQSSKAAARTLGISEQAVANHKQFVLSKLKKAAPGHVFSREV